MERERGGRYPTYEITMVLLRQNFGKAVWTLGMSGRDTGKSVNPPDAGYRRETYDHDTHNQPRLISYQIVWSYRSVNSHGMFSHIGSSAQRLPNGG
ncbi:MAG: hypothetical protein NTX50_12500, partial [Candidatus Sumerlaeota bacterium]|nr:hypothetical protein [Candidatus Sumerlaeota bacterium]